MLNVNEKSQFNDALGFLKRLDLYFRLANMYNVNSDLYNWIQQLNIIYLELYNFIPENEREAKQEELKDLRGKIDMELNKQRNNFGGIGRVNINLYWQVFNFHAYLKKIYGSSGLETKMLESAMDALR